jgi:type 1 fimbria pilin
MTMTRRGHPHLPVLLAELGAPVLALIAIAAGLAKTEAAFTMQVTGNDRARVAATCTVADGDTETRTVEITGRPPIRRRFGGDALTCTLRQTAAGGRVSLVLESASGNVSRITTGGRGSDVTLRIE